MEEMYHDGNRSCRMVRHPPPRRRIEDVLVHETFTAKDKAYIESRDMFFLATADEQGRPT